jgi:hypothetical protein
VAELLGKGLLTVAAVFRLPVADGQAVPVINVDSNGNPISGGGSHGTYANGSVALSTTPTDVFAAAPTRVRIKLINTDYSTASGGNGIVMWGRWGTVALAPAAPHGVGSFLILPGSGIDDQGSGVNTGALNVVAESGAPVLYAEQYT